jgi:hypothetical protein
MEHKELLLTIDEINQRLPLVRAIVSDIVTLFDDVAQRQTRLGDLRRSHPGNAGDGEFREEVDQMENELTRDKRQLEGFEEELQQVGGVLTNAMTGTVDFASEQSGDPVWLCWKLGEPEVMFWHSSDCGDDRLPLAPQSAGMTVDSEFSCGAEDKESG